MSGHLTITAVIPFAELNGGNLQVAIKSLVRQTVRPNHVVIVDNSLDGLEVDVTFKDYFEAFTILRTTPHIGAARARNLGAFSAKTDLIAFLDSDDAWVPIKIEEQLNFIISNNLKFSTTSFLFRRNQFASVRPFRLLKKPERNLNFRCHLGVGSTLIISAELFRRVDGFDETLLRFEDWDLMLRLYEVEKADFHLQDASLSEVNRNPNLSWDKADQALNLFQEKWLNSKSQFKDQIMSGVLFEKSVIEIRRRNLKSGFLHLSRSVRSDNSHLIFLAGLLSEAFLRLLRKLPFSELRSADR
jgi:glycosyltransferase involved in cell wall biosynthesis